MCLSIQLGLLENCARTQTLKQGEQIKMKWQQCVLRLERCIAKLSSSLTAGSSRKVLRFGSIVGRAMVTAMIRPVIFAGLLFSVGSTAAQQGSENAQTVLRNMLAKYESMSSYEDSGVLRVVPNASDVLDRLRPAPRESTVSQPLISFKTYFARSKRFRFEWKNSTSSRYSLIWFDEKNAYSWAAHTVLKRDRFLLERKADLDLLIQETIRPSAGMVFTVPSLLMKDLAPYTFGDMISSLKDLSVVKEETIDGERCYLIKGKVSNVPWLLWIGKRSYLLRKTRSFATTGFHQQRSTREDVIVEELRRDIKTNRRIPSAIFRYHPRLRPGDLDARDDPDGAIQSQPR
jgi:Predicted periplasmic protein (DUF2092)